ncbi:MAG: hypothetical protein ACRCVT_02675 [Leadbetterella sp.]
MYKLCITLFLALHSVTSIAQSVTIDPNSSNPSIIQANSTNQAVQLPRLGSTAAVASPQTGQIMYNQTTASPNFYNGLSWQNLSSAGNGGLYANFPNSVNFRGYNGTFYNSSTSHQNYTWTVPSGVTKIWVEAWGSGASGSKTTFPKVTGNVGYYYGGSGGNYMSTIIPVTSGNVLDIKVGNGSDGSWTDISYSYITLLSNTILGTAIAGQSNFSLTANASLLQFVQGEYFPGGSFHFEERAPGIFQIVVNPGNGGKSYPGQMGGAGNTYTILQPGGTLDSYAFNYGFDGSFPGGGGGGGATSGGKGAGGLIIIHY